MRQRFHLAALGLFSLAPPAAGCPADVVDGAGGGASVDPECMVACEDKGVSEEECRGYCQTSKSSEKGGSEKGGSQSSGTSGAGAGSPTSSSSTGGFDVAQEKSCIECWEEQAAGSCQAEYQACEQSLACIQLRNCPFQCLDKEVCLEGCNEIIPSGVMPLQALAQCMLCGSGPCASACGDSVYQAYCQ